jgi:hypothetical protein
VSEINEPGGTEKPAFLPWPGLREWAVFTGWICGLVLAGGLAWFFTQPLRIDAMMRSVNRSLARREDPRRLGAPLSLPRITGNSAPLGMWYSLEKTTDRFFVFPLIQDGPLALCGVRVSPEGGVEEFIPLSAHAEQALENLPPGIAQTYIRRIEALGFPDVGEKSE